MTAFKKLSLAGISLAVFLGGAGLLPAQGLDPASEEALASTLRLLLDPSLRNPAIAKDPQAALIDKQIRSLAGSERLTQEFFELAAQILDELARNSGGDVRKMSEAIERGKNDPAGFAALLSPQTLQRLRELSIKISDQPR